MSGENDFGWDANEPLHPDLEKYVVAHNSIPFFQSPFLVYPLYSPELAGLINNQHFQAEQLYHEALDEKNYVKAICVVARPYRWETLKRLKPCMDNKEFSELFSWVWSDSENIWQYLSEIRDMLQSVEPQYAMEDSEYEVYQSLPEKFEIHRGFTEDGMRLGHSWTTDLEQAQWFANRYSKDNPKVVTGLVSKSNVAMYIASRGESEIVVYNPEKIVIA